MKPKALLARLQAGQFANVHYRDFIACLEYCGWRLRRVRGSHAIYGHDGSPDDMNVQPAPDGTAKPYQLRAFLLQEARRASKGTGT